MRKLAIIISILILSPVYSTAQRWNKNKSQVIVGAGVTNFFGDLGGGNSTGKPGPADIDMAATRPALSAGYRYKFNNYIGIRSNLTWGILRGSDEFTEEPSRKGRNISFRSGILEVNVLGEVFLINSKRSSMYRLRGVNNSGFFGLELYLFGGVGFMYFNPKGEYQGRWFALQPLGTEGQGLPGQDEKYSRFALTIPFGIGLQKSLNYDWTIGLEASVRTTFTDYIDDVSTVYYGRENLYNDKIANGASQEVAERAAHFSDPNIYYDIPAIGTSRNNQLVGEKRGDPENDDSFVTVMFTISKKISKKRRGRAKF